MDKLLHEILDKISDPVALVLLLVLYFFYRLLDKKENQIERLTIEIQKNGITLAKAVELLKFLVHGSSSSRKRDEEEPRL
jgi:hypothetical protein